MESRFTWHYRLYDPLAECSGGDVLDYVCDLLPETCRHGIPVEAEHNNGLPCSICKEEAEQAAKESA